MPLSDHTYILLKGKEMLPSKQVLVGVVVVIVLCVLIFGARGQKKSHNSLLHSEKTTDYIKRTIGSEFQCNNQYHVFKDKNNMYRIHNTGQLIHNTCADEPTKHSKIYRNRKTNRLEFVCKENIVNTRARANILRHRSRGRFGTRRRNVKQFN